MTQVTHNTLLSAGELQHGLVCQHSLLPQTAPEATAPHPIMPWATQKPLLSES